ncbi:hypothetical protein PQQ96_06150, partial [Paraburkholderia sediminicola]
MDGVFAGFPEPATQIALEEKRRDEKRKLHFADKPSRLNYGHRLTVGSFSPPEMRLAEDAHILVLPAPDRLLAMKKFSPVARVVDSHLHFYDHKRNRHTFLDEVDRNYEAFVGNYDALPRRYLLDDYLADSDGYNVEAVVWHEFLSSDPFKEAAWAQQAATRSEMRH